MFVCTSTADDLTKEDEVKCVAETPEYEDKDCDYLLALLAKGKTHKDCKFYTEYTPPRELCKDKLLRRIRSGLGDVPQSILADIYELIKEKR